MQAKLEPSEFAYLLHALNAQKVVGVNHEQLFPNDPTLRDALLARGLASLQEHGWFVAHGNAINANDRLMLMAAVVAEPSYTFSATHYVRADLHQTLTYYISEGIVVEQFVTPDGDYVLSQLATIDAMVGRLKELYAPLLAALPEQKRLKVAANLFEAALAQAKAGDSTPMKRALLANDLAPDVLDEIVDMIAQLRPVGRIEAAALAGQHLSVWSELALVRAPNAAVWLVRQDNQANRIELVPASEQQFGQILDSLLKLVVVDVL